MLRSSLALSFPTQKRMDITYLHWLQSLLYRFLHTNYVDGPHLVSSQQDYGIELLGPVTVDPSWQAKAGQGFDAASFPIDWQAKTATCPQGKSSRKWKSTMDRGETQVIRVEFGKSDCLACPCCSQCTTAPSNPRQLTLRPQAQFEAIQAARQRQQTQEFKERYAIRAGIGGKHVGSRPSVLPL